MKRRPARKRRRPAQPIVVQLVKEHVERALYELNRPNFPPNLDRFDVDAIQIRGVSFMPLTTRVDED